MSGQPKKVRKRFRQKIENIGQHILERYGKKNQRTCVIMIPPIPYSKFIDKLTQDEVGYNAQEKINQDSYTAEAKLYRFLEDVQGKFVVIHQIDYTHHQYSAFLPNHGHCAKDNCEKGPEDHFCHKVPTELEGECDFVVVGDTFVAVFEVKGLSFHDEEESINSKQKRLECCCQSALQQRKRMVDLIKAMDPSAIVYSFTVFPNISSTDLDELSYSQSDETVLFENDVENIQEMFDLSKTLSKLTIGTKTRNLGDKVLNFLLGLWCIEHDNKWDLKQHSLSKSIKELDEKLIGAYVTRRYVDEAKGGETSKHRRKQKRYPENRDIVDAPDLFKKYLNIRCLTRDQLDLFQSKENLLWVEGPAGTGKTIAILGKIIDIALNSPSNARILFIIPAGDISVSQSHLKLLNKISDEISCAEVTHTTCLSLVDQLLETSEKIVLLKIALCVAHDVHTLMKKCFKYIFLDDFQTIYESANSIIIHAPSFFHKNLVSEVLLPIAEDISINNTTLWILCDEAQSWFIKSTRGDYNSPAIDGFEEFRSKFVHSKKLTINLRNSFEVSSVLSIVRRHYEDMEILPGCTVLFDKWVPQEGGHLLRGMKPVIHLMKLGKAFSIREHMLQELAILAGPDSYLENRDITVVTKDHHSTQGMLHTLQTILKNFKSQPNEKIGIAYVTSCESAEWTAVIMVYKFEAPKSESSTLLDLYIALSRARVYFSALIYDYIPNTCKHTDKLFEELRQRKDFCKFIE